MAENKQPSVTTGVDIPRQHSTVGMRVLTAADTIKTLLAATTAVFGVAGILLYYLARISAEAFYERLGLTPEDVGQSQETLLTHAALTAAALIFALVIIGAMVAFSSKHSRCYRAPLSENRPEAVIRMAP